MNFQDLLTRIKSIEEGNGAGAGDECDTNMPTSTDNLLIGEKGIGGDPTDDLISDVTAKECGMMPTAGPKQSDSVTMNVSMNGSGAGGIRDLMAILKNIEQGGGKGDVVFGTDENASAGATSSGAIAPIPNAKEEFANEPDTHVSSADAVTPTGNDLSSKGGEAEKVNGGGNPMGVDEALVQRLSQHYQRIKEDVGMPNTARPQQRAIDPVRQADVQQIPQKVSPQANRPGLAPNGDPKLWDIQFELQKKGYKIKADGLNGPATEKAAREAGLVHDSMQDIANPTAVTVGDKIGHTLGSGTGWIETAWRNIKQGFNRGRAGLEEGDEPKTMSRAAKGVMKYGKDGMKALAKAGKEGKDLDKVRDKYNKYD